MAYDYATQRPCVFTESGQIMFLRIRDNVKRLLAEAGAARFQEITKTVSGDSWDMIACVDRLVEIGELVEAPNLVSCAGQHRIFVSPTP